MNYAKYNTIKAMLNTIIVIIQVIQLNNTSHKLIIQRKTLNS